ncbi:MAG: hypothetical protein A2V88_02680 [Elusimicrobia bacterium RBG_16_66_12]|nr:MAG: hypothetical protein A2V88_02680 [Elusimicrobia bacterium RBG_16_66_12]
MDMNANLNRLDALVMASVIDKDLNAPPGASDGDRYIVGPSPTGAWASKAGQIAAWESGGSVWKFYPAKNGWHTYVEDERARYIFHGTAWVKDTAWANVTAYASFQAAHDALPTLGGTVFVPAHGALGNYSHATVPAFAGSGATPALTITKPMILYGEGRDVAHLRDAGSGAENRDSIFINRSGGVEVRGLTIIGAPAAGTGNLIHWYKAASNMDGLLVEACSLNDAMAWAFKSVPDATYYTARLRMTDVLFGQSYVGGAQGGSGGSGSGDVLIGGGTATGSNNLWFTRCEFHGPGYGTFGPGGNLKGNVHLNQASVVVFSNCSAQGKDTSPFLSMENWCTMIQLRDFYSENLNVTGVTAYRIIYDSASGALDHFTVSAGSHFGSDATYGARFFKTGGTNNVMNVRFENVSLRVNEATVTATDEISLGNAGHQVSLDNVTVYSVQDGSRRAARVTGGGLQTVASASTLTLPNSLVPICKVSGTTTINSIGVTFPGDRVTLIFTGALTVSDGAGNIKLATAYNTSSDDSITLACDGTDWYEVCRSGAV